MVFPGHFSKGCKRCRQRKIKCDERKPGCLRCEIYKKECPGYTDTFHFRFVRNSNTSGQQETRREAFSPRQRPRPRPRQQQQQRQRQQRRQQQRRQEEQPQQPQQQLPQQQQQCRQQRSPRATETVVNRNQQVIRVASRSPTIAQQLAISYDDVSLCYFIQRFVTPDEEDAFPGHLSFLPDLYNQGGNGLLEKATLSVAQMAAYNKFGGVKFRYQAYVNYHHAIRALKETIDTQDNVTDDRVLASVYILSMFKDIGEEGFGDPKEHAPGIYYLLERRGIEQLFTFRGFELFVLGLFKLQIFSFLNQDDRYNDPGGLVALLSQYDPLMRAMNLMIRTLHLRHSLLRCTNDLYDGQLGFNQNRLRRRWFEQDQHKLQACFEALEDFDKWDIEAQPYWQRTFGTRSPPSAFGTFSAGAKWYDPRTSCIVILTRSARLILLLSILEYYSIIEPLLYEDEDSGLGDPEAWAETIAHLEKNAQLTIDDMLYLVPFAMGDIGPDGVPVSRSLWDGAAALVIIQPVRLVSYSPCATPRQRQRAHEILSRMNSAIGVKSAMSWEDYSTKSSVPHRPGTTGLIYAMKMLSCRDVPEAVASSG